MQADIKFDSISKQNIKLRQQYISIKRSPFLKIETWAIQLVTKNKTLVEERNIIDTHFFTLYYSLIKAIPFIKHFPKIYGFNNRVI